MNDQEWIAFYQLQAEKYYRAGSEDTSWAYLFLAHWERV